MMARAKLQDVRTVLEDCEGLSNNAVEMGIVSASILVDDVAAGCGCDFNESRLKQIEIYLAAHFCLASDPSLSLNSESDGCSKTSATYSIKTGEGILGSRFGQMANTLSNGCLQEADKRQPAFFSIGSI